MKSTAEQKILCAAAKLFAAHGFDGVSTKHIAQAARANEITIFRRFGTKKQLFERVVQAQLEIFMASDRSTECMKLRPLRRALTQYCMSLLPRMSDTYLRLTLQAGMNGIGPPMRRVWIHAVDKHIYGPLLQRIVAEQNAGTLRQLNPETAARLLIAPVYLHALLTNIFKNVAARRLRKQAVSQYVDFWLRSMTPTQATTCTPRK